MNSIHLNYIHKPEEKSIFLTNVPDHIKNTFLLKVDNFPRVQDFIKLTRYSYAEQNITIVLNEIGDFHYINYIVDLVLKSFNTPARRHYNSKLAQKHIIKQFQEANSHYQLIWQHL